MGMFDIFVTKEDHKCTQCNYVVSRHTWQTKSILVVNGIFSEGIDYQAMFDAIGVKNGDKIKLNNQCFSCIVMIRADAIVANGKYEFVEGSLVIKRSGGFML